MQFLSADAKSPGAELRCRTYPAGRQTPEVRRLLRLTTNVRSLSEKQQRKVRLAGVVVTQG